MRIQYIKANPTENKTILVETQVPRKHQPEVAAKLLEADDDAEQVGFLEPPHRQEARLRLQMMGGEFCGNAAISAGAKIARELNMAENTEVLLPIEVSGANDIVNCRITFDGKAYFGTVDLPLPGFVKPMKLKFDGAECELTAVFLRGITHLIMLKKKAPGNYRSFAEKAVKAWASLFNDEAVGLILFDDEAIEIAPLVFVKPTDSLYWERGCGTGTAAVGAYLAYRSAQSCTAEVKQPGGIITASATCDNEKITALSITGSVVFESENSVEIDADF